MRDYANAKEIVAVPELTLCRQFVFELLLLRFFAFALFLSSVRLLLAVSLSRCILVDLFSVPHRIDIGTELAIIEMTT